MTVNFTQALILTMGIAACSGRNTAESALPVPCREFQDEIERSRNPDFFQFDAGMTERRQHLLEEGRILTLRFDRCFNLLAPSEEAYAQARDAFGVHRQQLRESGPEGRQVAIEGMLDLLPVSPRPRRSPH